VRCETFFGDLRTQVQNGVERLPRVIGVPLSPGECFGVEPVVEQELQVPTGQQE
jgi:hypothetical protein